MSSSYLFLDSSLDINIGILDSSLTWKYFETIANRKGSSVLHSIIFNVLKEAQMSLSAIESLIVANGPGSYTGIRLSEGIAQILALENIPCYSFYHFEVPHFCGFDHYKFYANAFKGEVFEYAYESEAPNLAMIKKESFDSMSFDADNLFHINGELHDKYLESTATMIKNNPKSVFSKVLERGKHFEPYYFRSAEKEFKPTQFK